MGLDVYHFKLTDHQQDEEDYILITELSSHTNAKKEWLDKFTIAKTINCHQSIAVVERHLYSEFEEYFQRYYQKVFFEDSLTLKEEIQEYELERGVSEMSYYYEYAVVEKTGGISIFFSPHKELKGKKNSYKYRLYSIPTESEVCPTEDAGYMVVDVEKEFFNEYKEGFYYALKDNVEGVLQYLKSGCVDQFKKRFIDNFEEGRSLITFGYE
ncbi:hypothetical protein D770_04850 [Flammeovirgaceae bacterium 311]|nr:hypothetical protein D770_04850 [Flammeovirgaceae bacterium 311]